MARRWRRRVLTLLLKCFRMRVLRCCRKRLKVMSDPGQFLMDLRHHFIQLLVVHWSSFQDFLPQRLLAALAAICERFFGDRAAARAAPPFNPPRRPSATASGFFGLIAGGSVLGASPMDSRNTRWASWLGSRGRVFERSGITATIMATGV